MIAFYTYMLYFLYSICISLFAESMRKTVIQNGYPGENLEAVEWRCRDYITWLCYFIDKKAK